jgi:hypothetical protein
MNEQQRRFVHYSRLERDYQSMMNLRGDKVSWTPLTPPEVEKGKYPEVYRVTLNIRAPTTKGDSDHHVLRIDCSSLNYPFSPPLVSFETPAIKHPHVYSDNSRRVCLGGFPLEELLGELCIRLIRFFQYDPALINHRSIASKEFYEWYELNKANLPLDNSPLPVVVTPTPKGMRIKAQRQYRP